MRENKFWKKVGKILRVFEPLVKVLRLNDKPTMGFIYEAMDWAKQVIIENVRYHEAYINTIDAHWNDQLHHPLHVAGN